ncbi:MAG: hypothetical protein RBT71_13760 [Flavobacteriales bacterium]|jgi:hypothetical protein|nr:hypothetical protein [Flavobacteriales bacterium]
MSVRNIHRGLAHLLCIGLVIAVLPACNKEEPTKAVVIVKLADGTPASGALVKLHADPPQPVGDPNRLNKEATTGADGRAEFDYSDFYEQGQAGFAVLDILCTLDSLTGMGMIKITEEEVSEETVVLE